MAKATLKIVDGNTEKPVRIPGENSDRRSMTATPYSIFIHNSPVYKTSEMLTSRRPGRPSVFSPCGKRRQLPFRPDGYPYANRRWTDRLRSNPSTLSRG
jgi:hypothetical protein